MAFLGSAFDLPDGARLTGISDLGPDHGALRSGLVTAHRVAVAADQQAATEVGFTGAHLPFSVCGFTGNNPDGSEWFVTFQAIDPGAARRLCGPVANPPGLLTQALERALAFNRRASICEEVTLSVDDLREVYDDRDVPADLVASWTARDLIRGLVAELCGADLATIAPRHAQGCAYPGTPHDCQGDAFADVFTRWVDRGGVTTEEPA